MTHVDIRYLYKLMFPAKDGEDLSSFLIVLLSRVLRDSTPRYVGRLVGRSVGRSVGRLVGRSVPFLLFWRF